MNLRVITHLKGCCYFCLYILCLVPTVVSAESDSIFTDKLKDHVTIKADNDSGVSESLTLLECIQLALENNFDLQRARQEIEREGGSFMEARAFSLPVLQATANFERIDEERLPNFNESAFGANRSWRSDVELQQPLFLGGEGISRIRRGTLLKEAAFEGILAQTNLVLLEVRERFYDVLLARAQLEVEEQSVELLKIELDQEKNKLEAGTVSELNVLRAEVALANARAPFIRARDDLRLALDELLRVLGLRHDQLSSGNLKINGSLEGGGVDLDMQSALLAAKELRPEFRQLSLLIKAREQGIDIERAAFFPTLALFAGYGWESSRFGNDLGEIDHGWIAGLRASWRIFDSFETRGRVIQARAEKRISEIELARERENIELEVRRAYSSLIEARELVEASRKVVAQGEESLRLAKARFDVGSAQQIEVLDAQVALTEARTNQIVAFHSKQIAIARLEKATGMQLNWVKVGDSGDSTLAEKSKLSDKSNSGTAGILPANS